MATDSELLRAATVANMNWAGEQRFTYADIDAAPRLRQYCRLLPERGDYGFVALAESVLGVVWVQYFSSTDPGFGYVDDATPELSVSVWTGYRGAGIGRRLVACALNVAQSSGVRRVSLSVEDGNPALRLYRSLGFVPAAHSALGTHIVELLPAPIAGT